MSREITVVTPENIPLTLELAGLGSRFGALMVDILIQMLVTVTLAVVGGIVVGTTGLSLSQPGQAVASWLITAGILAFFLIWFGYFILFETLWNGQTPGKKMFGLRVLRDGGYPINVFSVLARNLVRIADFLPSGYGVGALVVFLHPEYKRLGDLAAGTLVVKERVAATSGTDFLAPSRPAVAPDLPPSVRHPADVLTVEELDLLRRFSVRRWEMTPDDSERFAYRLIVPLIPRLNLTFVTGAAPRYADLVSVLVAAADAREDSALR